MANKKKAIKIGTINPNGMGRDYVHMREITHGTGAGAHKSKKDYNRKQQRNIERQSKDWPSALCIPFMGKLHLSL